MAAVARGIARRSILGLGLAGAWIAAHGALLLLRDATLDVALLDLLWAYLLGTVAGAAHLLLRRPLRWIAARLLGGGEASLPTCVVAGAAGGVMIEAAAFCALLGAILASYLVGLASMGVLFPLAFPMLLLQPDVEPPVLPPLLAALLGGGIEAGAWAWRARRQRLASGDRDPSWRAIGDDAGRELERAAAALPATVAWVALFGAAHLLVLVLPDPLSLEGRELGLLVTGCAVSGIGVGLLHAAARRRTLARFSHAAGSRIVAGIALAAGAEAVASLGVMGVALLARGLELLLFSGPSLRVDGDWWWMFASPGDIVSILRHAAAVLLAGGGGEALARLLERRAPPRRATIPSCPS